MHCSFEFSPRSIQVDFGTLNIFAIETHESYMRKIGKVKTAFLLCFIYHKVKYKAKRNTKYIQITLKFNFI